MLQRCFAQSLLVLVVSGVRDTSPAFKGHVKDFVDRGNFSLTRLDQAGNTSVATGLCEPTSVARDVYYCLSLAFPLPVFPEMKIEGALRIRFLSDVQNCFQFVVTASIGVRVLFFAVQIEFDYSMAQIPRSEDALCSDVRPTSGIVMSYIVSRVTQWAKGTPSKLDENAVKINEDLYKLKTLWEAQRPTNKLYETPFDMDTLGESLDWIYIATKREFQKLRAELGQHQPVPKSIPEAFRLLMKAYSNAKGAPRPWEFRFHAGGTGDQPKDVQSCFDLDAKRFFIKEWMWCYFTQMYDFSIDKYRELVSALSMDLTGTEHLRLWKNVDDHSLGLIVEASASICDHDGTESCLVTFPRDFLALYPATSNYLITYLVFSGERYTGGDALANIWEAMQQQWGDVFYWAYRDGVNTKPAVAHDECAGLNPQPCMSKEDKCFWVSGETWETSCLPIETLDCQGLPSGPCVFSPHCTWEWSGNWETSCVSRCTGQPQSRCGEGCKWNFKGDENTACVDWVSDCEGRTRGECDDMDGCKWTPTGDERTACNDVKGKKVKQWRYPYDRFLDPDMRQEHDRLLWNNVFSKVAEEGGNLYKSFSWMRSVPAWERFVGAYAKFLKNNVVPAHEERSGFAGQIAPTFDIKDTFAISLTATSGNMFEPSTNFCSAPYMEFRIQHVWNLNSWTNEKTCISGRAWIAPIKENKKVNGQLWMFRFDPKWCYEYHPKEGDSHHSFKFPIGLRQGTYSCLQSLFNQMVTGDPEKFICLDVEGLAFRKVNEVLKDFVGQFRPPPSPEAGEGEDPSSIEDKLNGFVRTLETSILAAVTIMAKNALLGWAADVLSEATALLSELMPAALVAECLHYSQQIVETTEIWSKGEGAIQDPSVGFYNELVLKLGPATLKGLYQFEAKFGSR